MQQTAAAKELWSRRSGLAVVDRKDRTTILDLGAPGAHPVLLEGAAPLIWRQTAAPCSAEAMIVRLAALTGEREDDIREDVLAFLCTLAALGFLEASPAPSTDVCG
ncbi:PqqD family protein [Rathayibacter tritici]|uniref:PqqD family protein n=1 Tax=Rathayibacter tritici TaxID=33888 RepID=UPI00082CD437|nr:PqqD family protein [Rathayibacter tritici]PPF31819.1 PqqD family protein [Rathayibacter tritici]PPF68401.1 PqqD family protein [Rathayibacter tritici]PPG07212.1 PqqD family protein [Rathayibacter tritici]PPI12978.1 PqqD family protein [Rathayibacter tritici]PPI42946.1 PqqD family protein [Rathayibacter tritici]